MTIAPDKEAEILRLFHAEKWKLNTIADQLGLHHTTVERVLRDKGSLPVQKSHPSLVDPYRPFLKETLEKYPTIPSSRLFDMARERGYPGRSDGHFRRIVSAIRPQPSRLSEAYLRLRTLPGEQAQVDWGHFGPLLIGKARRFLLAFVLVLSFSRMIFLRFFTDQRVSNFLRGHVEAFNAIGGVPRVILYDNPKTIVLERQKQAIRFNQNLLELSAYYHYEPRPVTPARGNEKGRVERAIGYARKSFWPARTFDDLDDLNAQAETWCTERAAERRWPEDRTTTVRDAFLQEKALLLPLPDNPFPTDERCEVRSGKTPYVRFDLNDYSIPHTHVRKSLTLIASPDRVRIFDGTECLADHPRSYDARQQIEIPAHVEALVEAKHAARQHRGFDRLEHAASHSQAFLVAAAQHGHALGGVTSALLKLLDLYGPDPFDAALTEALEQGVPHPHAVRLSLERRRLEQQQPPPVDLPLPDDPKIKNLVVKPHSLADYDNLQEKKKS
jgi:transposase